MHVRKTDHHTTLLYVVYYVYCTAELTLKTRDRFYADDGEKTNGNIPSYCIT